VHEENPLKRRQLQYYKLGDGPFYVFHTPYHLPHIQVASTIGRAARYGDPTVTPKGGPVCEVVAVAKRDLRVGERLDGVGGFCAYGLIDNTAAARRRRALPIGLTDECTLVRDVPRDAVITEADVKFPAARLRDVLWDEQRARWESLGAAAQARVGGDA
jgi:predicted homoserine dehydrogenase-like protein